MTAFPLSSSSSLAPSFRLSLSLLSSLLLPCPYAQGEQGSPGSPGSDGLSGIPVSYWREGGRGGYRVEPFNHRHPAVEGLGTLRDSGTEGGDGEQRTAGMYGGVTSEGYC